MELGVCTGGVEKAMHWGGEEPPLNKLKVPGELET